METIDQALENDEGSSESVVAERTVGTLAIEVRLRKSRGALTVRPDSRDAAATLLDGWAENVKCVNCETPVALLFVEAYLESST